MIADFRYEARPKPDCIAVQMLWESGERRGFLKMPEALADDAAIDDFPVIDTPITLNGALAYGLYLSMSTGRALRLTGDLSVWQDSWGHLSLSH